MEKRYIDIDIASLVPYDKNPRKNDIAVADVAESMEQVGYITPIVVDENFLILAGETRCKALKKRNVKRDKVLQVIGLTEEQKKKYRLLDNKVGEVAEWDYDLLLGELDGMDFDGFDFGFDDLIANLSADIEDEGDSSTTGEAEEDDFEPELPEEPVSKPGDIWLLGRHRLGCIDSTNVTDVAKLMDGKQADLLLTDPPYNCGIVGGTGLTIQNDNMDDASFRQFLRDAFICADLSMKAGAAFYIWHSDGEGLNFRGAVKDVGWKFHECLIWNKNSLVLGRCDYQYKHEPCLYGWKPGAAHTWLSDRSQTTVLDYDRPTKSADHPTTKPIALFDYQIRNSCPEGGLVLDLFGGSGTTMIACEQDGRTAYLAELDPKYCDVIIRRFEEFTGEKAVLLNQQ